MDKQVNKLVNKYRVDEMGNIYENDVLIIPYNYDQPLEENQTKSSMIEEIIDNPLVNNIDKLDDVKE